MEPCFPSVKCGDLLGRTHCQTGSPRADPSHSQALRSALMTRFSLLYQWVLSQWLTRKPPGSRGGKGSRGWLMGWPLGPLGVHVELLLRPSSPPPGWYGVRNLRRDQGTGSQRSARLCCLSLLSRMSREGGPKLVCSRTLK